MQNTFYIQMLIFTDIIKRNYWQMPKPELRNIVQTRIIEKC
jgi:hypothetical protein